MRRVNLRAEGRNRPDHRLVGRFYAFLRLPWKSYRGRLPFFPAHTTIPSMCMVPISGSWQNRTPTSSACAFMHGQSYAFQCILCGDTVAFVHAATTQRFANGRVKSVGRVSDREIMLTFEEPVPAGLEDHDCVENMTWTPEVLIREQPFYPHQHPRLAAHNPA